MAKIRSESAPQMHDGVEMVVTDEIHIDVSLIPPHVQYKLSEMAMGLVRNILKQPGGREALDAKTAARKALSERG